MLREDAAYALWTQQSPDFMRAGKALVHMLPGKQHSQNKCVPSLYMHLHHGSKGCTVNCWQIFNSLQLWQDVY